MGVQNRYQNKYGMASKTSSQLPSKKKEEEEKRKSQQVSAAPAYKVARNDEIRMDRIKNAVPEKAQRAMENTATYRNNVANGKMKVEPSSPAKMQERVNDYLRTTSTRSSIMQRYTDPKKFNSNTMDFFGKVGEYTKLSDDEYRKLRSEIHQNRELYGLQWSNAAIKALDDAYMVQRGLSNYAKSGLEQYYAIKTDTERQKRQSEYDKLRSNSDFSSKSQTLDPSMRRGVNLTPRISDIWNGMTEAAEAAMSLRHMTDDQVQMYRYIFNTQGADKAKDYYDFISYDLNKKNTEEVSEIFNNFTLEHPVMGNAASVGLNAISGIGYIDDTIKKWSGEEIDPNSLLHMPSNVVSGIRQTTSDQIDSDVGKFIYNQGMSMIDSHSGTVVGLLTGNPAIALSTLGLLSLSSASNTVIDAKNRGLEDNQAYMLGAVSGAIEYITESLSMDRFYNSVLKGDFGFKESLIQGLTEGSEELVSSSVNLLTDLLVSKDKSNWEYSINGYMQQGLSREEAVRKAVLDQAGEIALDFAGGFLSGAVMGGGAVGFNRMQNNHYNRQVGNQVISAGNADALKDYASQFDESTDAYYLASEYGTEKPKKSETGKLYREAYSETSHQIKENATDIISNRLTELGETEHVADIAEAVKKYVYGEELSEKDSFALNSRYARQVTTEFMQSLNGNNVIGSDLLGRLSTLRDYTVQHKKLNNTITVNSTGERSEIAGIKSVDENDVVTYNLKNGGTATSEDITFEDEITERVANSVQRYGIAGADAFIKMYNGEEAEVYTRAFDTMFKQGVNDPEGKLENDVMNSASAKILNPAQNKAAYVAGRVYAQKLSADTQQKLSVSEARAEAVRNIAQRAPHKTKGNVNVANIRTKSLTPKQNASIKAMSEISKVTGGTLKMVAFESKANLDGIIKESNGWYDAKTNTLYFDINAGVDNEKIHGELDRAILRTGSHELTHFVQNMSPEYYAGLKGFIVDSLNSADPNRTEQLISAKLKALPKLSYDEALDEVIADSCEMLLRDSKAIKKLARENMTLAQKIKTWVDDFVKNIKKAFEGVSAKSQEAVILEQILGDMTELQNMWDEALEDALRKSKEKGTANGTQENSNIKHSIRYTTDNKPVVVIEENILDGVPENEWVKTVKTVMSENFSAGIPIKGRLVKVNRITKREYVNSNDTRKYEKKSPEIYKDKLNTASQLNEIVLASTNYINEAPNHSRKKDNFKDFARGEVLMHIDTNSYEANVIVALDGKNEMVLYDIVSFKPTNFTIKKEAKSLTVAPNKDINDSLDLTSNNSVPPTSENVNKIQKSDRAYLNAVESGDIETAQRMVDEAAEQSMPDSIIRDKNGKLLSVYHGSPGKFTVFNHSKMNTNGNAHGRGFYFTEEKSMAEGYKKDGGQLLKGYLNITNPMSEEKVSIKKSDLVKYIKATCIQEAKNLVADGGYDTVDEALPDTWISNYVYTYGMNLNNAYREVAEIIYNNDNDVDIVAEISNVVGTEIALKKAYEVLGYDGVIYTNDRGTHEYVSLISNQFKSAEAVTYDDNGNVIPLSERFKSDNPDIRYSKRGVNSEEAVDKNLVNGISEDGTTIIGKSSLQFSERTYENGGRDYLSKWLEKKVKSKFISKADAEDIIAQTDAMLEIMKDIKANNELPDYARWAETDITADENGKKISVIVKNGDYAMNLDLSLVCKKRVALNAVLNALVQSNDLSIYTLTETDVAELNKIIKEHEFEIACALCFVDSKRYRVGSWADSFCEGTEDKNGKKYGFNEMVRSLVPKGSKLQIDEFNFTGRNIVNQPTKSLLKDADDTALDFTLIDKIMRENNPSTAQYRYATAIKNNKDLRSILNPSEIISSIGLDAIRTEHTKLFGLINGHQGTAKPKFAHQSVAFKNDILQASSWTPEKAKMVGGVRMQSFSDFMANMVFDYVQMISELSAKNLTSHAYTKEPLFVKLFGLTGIKINMSLVPKVNLTEEQIKRFNAMTDSEKESDAEYQHMKKTAGLSINENGEIEYSWEDETFPYDVAMDIMSDKRYTPNCGTICVGISSPHIRKLLNDDRISMVIPYHKSGLNKLVAQMRNIALYNDYTNVQNTRYLTGDKLDTKKHKDFDFYGDLYGTDGKEGTHDPKTTADNYLKFCDENNYLPKFDEFRNEPNYYKLLIDFTVYDINNNMAYTEQSPVKPIYPSNEEFKDLIVNGVVKNGITYGGLKQAQDTADRLDAETQEIIEEFRSVLKAKHGQDVLSQKQFSERTSESENLSHRELLRNALSTVAQNDTERDFLARYQREIKDVEKKYEEVAKLRRQIHDISFTKGSDRSQLPAIKNRVAILEDQIQRTDKKLLQLEATKALKDVVEREKKTAVKKANERNKQTYERYKSRKRSSEVREKIKKLHKKIVKSLLYPTDSNYIPSDLAKSMIDVCMAIDFSTDRTAPDGGKTKAQEKRESITKALEKLKDHYEELEESKDDLLKDAYDIEIRNELRELVKTSKVSRIGEMSETQLNAVYQSLKSIYGTLLDAKKMIGTEEGRAISEIGLGIIEEQRQIDRKKKGVKKLGQKYSDLVAWNTVSPMRNILRISGYDKNSELYQLAEQLNEGQRKKDIFVMESHKMFEHLIDGKENKKKYQDAIGKAHDFGVVDVDGNAVEMSKMTAMQLVMSWEREMASDGKHSHLQQSGAIIPNHKLLMNGKVSEAVSAEHAQRIDVNEDLIRDIVDQLDEWDMEYMEVAHKFFDEKSKNALNETSRVVSHRDVALSEKYIPYKVDEDFVFKKEISDENHIRPTLISMGMLKDTVRNAGQPLVMTSLNHVLDTQIEQVGAYYGLAIPVRNFNKVWNFMSDNRISVRESITKNWGLRGTMVIDDAIRDLQASRPNDNGKFRSFDIATSAFVRSVLNSNISVTLKQLSALPSAYSVLNQRFNGAVYGQFLKMCVPSKYNETIKEIDKYTAAHWLRRQGLSSQELGEIAKSMGKMKRFNDWLPAAINPTKWIQGMDCLVTASFWDMCKKDIRKQGEFEEGTEEFNRAVADLYNRVIEDTQAVYDTLHRPEVLRTTHWGVRQVFMFRSESLQHSGILYEKYGAMLANKNKETVRDFAKTAYAQYSSAMLFAILSLVGPGLLHKMNPYRDEDEELTPESVFAELLNDFTNAIFDLLIPIGGAQIQELIYGKISKNKFLDGKFSVPTIDFVNEFIGSASDLEDKLLSEEPEGNEILKAVENLTFKFVSLFGIPADNVKNIIKTFKLHIEDAVNGEFGSFEAGVDRSNTVNYHRATEALVEGDMQKYNDVIAELNENGVQNDKIQQGIRNQLKDFYLDGRLTDKQAIEFLAKYGGDDDENDAYFTVKSWKELDGSFSKYGDLREAISSGGDVDSAINELLTHGYTDDRVDEEISKAAKEAYKKGEINENSLRQIFSKYLGKDDGEIHWLLDELNYYKSNPSAESGDYQKYGDLFTVIDQGGSADIAGTVKEYMDNGVSKKSISSTLTKQYKDKYIELYNTDKTAAANLKNSLLRAYYAAGYNWDYKSKDIDAWLKDS